MRLSKAILFTTLIIFTALAIACSNNNSDVQNTDENLPESFTEINQKISEDPNNPDLYIKRSDLFIEIDSIDRALNDIQYAIELNETEASYYIKKADIIFIYRKKPVQAIDILKEGRALNNEDLEIVKKISELFMMLQQPKFAMAYLDTLYAMDETNAETFFMRGFVFIDLGDTAKAIQNFQRCLERKPEHLQANIKLGNLFDGLNNPIALDYYNNALNINPNSVEALYNIGKFYQDRKQYNEAIEAYTSATSAESNSPFKAAAYYGLGYIHIELKVWTEARNYFGMALQTNPNYVEAYYAKGYAHEMLGDVMNAKSYYEQALRLNPNYGAAQHALNRVNEIINRPLN